MNMEGKRPKGNKDCLGTVRGDMKASKMMGINGTLSAGNGTE